MRTLRNLLATWENWSARNTLDRALNNVTTIEARDPLRCAIDETPSIDPLNALRDSAELVALLRGWRWQPVGAARAAGASWEQVGAATGASADEARAEYLGAVQRVEQVRPGSTQGADEKIRA